MGAGVDDDGLAVGQQLGEMATGVSLSLRGAQVHDIARAERERAVGGLRAAAGRGRRCRRPGPRRRGRPGASPGRRGPSVALRPRYWFMNVPGEPANCPSHDPQVLHARRRTARSGRPGGRPAPATWRSGTGSSSAVWSTLIPIPITTIGGRVLTRSTRIPQTFRSPISTSLGHFSRGEATEGARHGVPRDQREHRPPLGVDDRVEDGRERQGRPRRGHPLPVEPAAARLLVVGHHDPVAHRVGGRERVGRAGLGVQAHLPLRARPPPGGRAWSSGDRAEGVESMALDWPGRHEEATQ